MYNTIVGDLHLGRKHKVTYGDSAIWSDRSLQILSSIDTHTLVLAGDVFDTSKPSSLDYALFIAAIAKFKEVYIIAGNHDISNVKEDIAFNKLAVLPQVTLVPYGQFLAVGMYVLVAWQPTNDAFNTLMNELLQAIPDKVFVVHASRISFGNEMDNVITDEHITLAKKNNSIIISGHQHSSDIGETFSHIGSVVPHSISEVGDRYIWVDEVFEKLPPLEDIILTREEPLVIDPDKCYYVKTGKEVTVEDVRLEAKDLSIDIIDSFWEAAVAHGFDKGILND